MKFDIGKVLTKIGYQIFNFFFGGGIIIFGLVGIGYLITKVILGF